MHSLEFFGLTKDVWDRSIVGGVEYIKDRVKEHEFAGAAIDTVIGMPMAIAILGASVVIDVAEGFEVLKKRKSGKN